MYSNRQCYSFLAILFGVSISNNFDYYVLGVVLEPIKSEFHVSDTQLGFLSGFCFALFYAIAALPFARWSDRGNRRTVLTVALAGWSVMTVFFGLAQTFWQLGIARFGVGAMEPGATPPAQSLIADYFPPRRRSSALAIVLAGSSVGYLLGLALGGHWAATMGWRSAFLIAGVVGILLAVVTRLTLGEPRQKLGFPSARPDLEGMGEAMRRLRAKRSFVFTVIGVSVLYFFSLGVTTFLPSFMIRILNEPLGRISTTWGVAISLSNLLGTLAGGWVADRLSVRDVRWYAWLSAIGCTVGAALYWVALSSHDLWAFVSMNFAAEFMIWGGAFSTWPAIHAICGNARRGTAIAVTQFAYVLLGVGLGPLAAGALSDVLEARFGAQSLRYSLHIMTLSLIPAAAAFLWSARTMSCDRED